MIQVKLGKMRMNYCYSGAVEKTFPWSGEEKKGEVKKDANVNESYARVEIILR